MIYVFNHGEELISELQVGELMAPEQIETLDGFTRLNFFVKLPFVEKMAGAEFVAHKDVTDENHFYMYKLVTARNGDDAIEYVAVNIAYDDLNSYGYLREYRMEKTTAPLALDTILKGSRWRVGKTEQTGQADFYIYDLSRLEAIQKLIEIFGVELNFRVTISGNQITGRYVDLYQKRGTDTGLRFYYGKNALDVVREESRQDIFTAVIGRGKGEEKFDSSGQSTGGFGRRINFKDVEWIKGAPVKEDDPMYGVYETYPLDKPLGEEYLELEEATKRQGYSDGTARYKIVVHDQITDPMGLLWASYEDLLSGARTLVHFKSTVHQVGNLNLGDWVRVIREDLDIYYRARVFKVVRDLLDPLNTKIELGDNLEHKQGIKNKAFADSLGSLNDRVSEVASSTQYTFNQVIEDMRAGLENSYYNADGYNYELKTGNKYSLPAGYYSFNEPIEEDPSKVIYMGAGMMAIANRKKSDGTWDWRTFGTGDGLFAETIIGTLGEFARVNANQINVSNDFADTELGKKVVVQDELYNNVKITQAKGIQVMDNQARERVQLGNWAFGRYGLKLTDPSGKRTVLDDEGILQSWQDSKCDNVASGKPLYLRLYVPKETKTIYKALLRVWTDYFRSFSVGAKYGGYKSDTTDSGGYDQSGDTSNYGGGDVVSSNVESWEYGDDGHNHGLKSGYSIWSAKPGADTGTYLGAFVSSGLHTHSVQIPSHTHQFSFTIPSHTHRFTVDSHQHDIEYGIYEASSTGSNFEIFINGADRTSVLTGGGYFQGTQDELDITPYLGTGRWNTIEIRSRSLCRVDACVFIQALLQYAPS